jgi:hypothetical protein
MRDGNVEYFMNNMYALDGFEPFRLNLSDDSKSLVSQILVNEIEEQNLLSEETDHGMVWDIFLWRKDIPPESLLDEDAIYMTEEDWEKFFMESPPE